MLDFIIDVPTPREIKENYHSSRISKFIEDVVDSIYSAGQKMSEVAVVYQDREKPVPGVILVVPTRYLSYEESLRVLEEYLPKNLGYEINTYATEDSGRVIEILLDYGFTTVVDKNPRFTT